MSTFVQLYRYADGYPPFFTHWYVGVQDEHDQVSVAGFTDEATALAFYHQPIVSIPADRSESYAHLRHCDRVDVPDDWMVWIEADAQEYRVTTRADAERMLGQSMGTICFRGRVVCRMGADGGGVSWSRLP